VADRPWYEKGERIKVSNKAKNYFSPTDSDINYPIDSSLYTRLIDNGSSEFCAMVTAFTMSDVKMERHLPNRCHNQVFYFQNCNAFILEDTVNIVFKTQNPRRSMASNKIMRVRILGNEHHTDIIHWGDEKQEVVNRDGSISVRNAPKSKVINTRLKLNKNSYELGDTIIGELKVVSVQYKGKRKTKVKEEAFGKFRAIVGGYDIDCNINESLAHSWLK
jgi:hypothetical protein